MHAQTDKLQERVCRACHETYSYPVPRSAATRFHCAACAELPAAVRELAEKQNRRIRALAATVAKLEAKVGELLAVRPGATKT